MFCPCLPGRISFLRVRVLRLRKSSIRSGIFVEHPYRMAQAPSGAASRVLPSSYAAPMELNRTLWLAYYKYAAPDGAAPLWITLSKSEMRPGFPFGRVHLFIWSHASMFWSFESLPPRRDRLLHSQGCERSLLRRGLVRLGLGRFFFHWQSVFVARFLGPFARQFAPDWATIAAGPTARSFA